MKAPRVVKINFTDLQLKKLHRQRESGQTSSQRYKSI